MSKKGRFGKLLCCHLAVPPRLACQVLAASNFQSLDFLNADQGQHGIGGDRVVCRQVEMQAVVGDLDQDAYQIADRRRNPLFGKSGTAADGLAGQMPKQVQ
jgi:hypothetical protein